MFDFQNHSCSCRPSLAPSCYKPSLGFALWNSHLGKKTPLVSPDSELICCISCSSGLYLMGFEAVPYPKACRKLKVHCGKLRFSCWLLQNHLQGTWSKAVPPPVELLSSSALFVSLVVMCGLPGRAPWVLCGEHC